MKRKLPERTVAVAHPPLLLIGWGREGVRDIAFARNAFPYDKGLDCVDAQEASGDEVLDEITRWLKDNQSAQILYIGSHGGKDGLFPKTRARTKISWSRLATALSTAKTSITVCLGACSSNFAAADWDGNGALPVKSIIGFSGTPTTPEIIDFLVEVITNSNVVQPGKSLDERELSFLPEDIIKLRESVPKATVHYKRDDSIYVDCSTLSKMELTAYFDSQCNRTEVAHLYSDVLFGVAVPDEPIERTVDEEKTDSLCDKLGVRKLPNVKQLKRRVKKK